ncbi:MAG: prepilin peptidase [Atopobiaceae bacterium]|nr:prepilin peptidase [Atopobiaceae bacterium]
MQLDSPLLLGYVVCVAGILGLVMGSFLNCLAWRMTHGESVLHGRSHCTSCGHVLGPRDLVPVLSWALSRGRCRYCGERVSWRYPATELFTAIVYVSLAVRYGLTLEMLELVAFASVLLVLSLTDLDEYLIPNATIVAAMLVRVAYIVAMGATGQADAMALLRDSLVGGVVVAVPILLLALVMDRVLGRESLGGGDVKLLFVAGLYFGWQQCLFLVVVACVLGLLLAVLGVNGGGDGDDPHLIPFGPSIALACWITMLVGGQVVTWYVGLFMG